MNRQIMVVKDLRTYYKTRLNEHVCAVDSVSLQLKEREIMGIAGESGCGKSTLALSLMGYYFPPLNFKSGSIKIDDVDIMKLEYEDLRKQVLGKKIAYIPQAAMNALNPTKKIIRFIEDIMKEHHPELSKEQVYNMACKRFESLNLPKRVLTSFPNELSGGMKQRTVIAISTILNPKILIADEPTSALDVTSQKIVIKMLKDLLDRGFVRSIIFITHELPLLRHIADVILIMYAGEIVESGKSNDVIFDPIHPYSKALMGSIIVPEEDMKNRELMDIPGAPPNLVHTQIGCRFSDRCKFVKSECRKQNIEDKVHYDRVFKCIFDFKILKELQMGDE